MHIATNASLWANAVASVHIEVDALTQATIWTSIQTGFLCAF
jgi:hypothetical protein